MLGSTVENTFKDGENKVSAEMNNGYNTTQTSSQTDMTTNTSNVWLWVILAAIALVIIALVWYYTSQTNNNSSRH